MPDDDEVVRARLSALEAEVKAEAEVKRRRRAEAEDRVRAQRAKAEAERDQLRARQAAIVKRKSGSDPQRGRRDGGDLDTALELARKAGAAKQELSKPRQPGEKSWLISGGASFLFGPLGWLYAGAWRETIPAAAIYLIVASVAAKILPMFLLMPVLMVLLPISGIAGVVYAIGYNRHGKRIRLFGDDKKDEKELSERRLGRLGAGRDDD